MVNIQKFLSRTDIKKRIERYLHNLYVDTKIKNIDYSKMYVKSTPIRIESTNSFNLKRVTCPQNHCGHIQKIEIMDVALFEKIINDNYEYIGETN